MCSSSGSRTFGGNEFVCQIRQKRENIIFVYEFIKGNKKTEKLQSIGDSD